MLPIGPGHAVNLKNVVYIKMTGGVTAIYTADGEKRAKKGKVAADLERAFADARIPILFYSTPSGDQTIISIEHVIEMLDDLGSNSVTYKLKGGFALKIDGGGNFLTHLKTANAASAEYQQQQPAEALVSGSAHAYMSHAHAGFVPATIAPTVCGQCGIKGATLRCSGCRSVYYCSPVHQALHWESGHQFLCNPVSKEKEEE